MKSGSGGRARGKSNVAQFRTKTEFTVSIDALTTDHASPNCRIFIPAIGIEMEKPIVTLEFLIDAYRLIRQHIQARLLWRYDARPLILAMRDQFLWDIKIIETSCENPFSQIAPERIGLGFSLKASA